MPSASDSFLITKYVKIWIPLRNLLRCICSDFCSMLMVLTQHMKRARGERRKKRRKKTTLELLSYMARSPWKVPGYGRESQCAASAPAEGKQRSERKPLPCWRVVHPGFVSGARLHVGSGHWLCEGGGGGGQRGQVPAERW